MFEIPRGRTRKWWTVPLASVGELAVVVIVVMIPARHMPVSAELVSKIIFAPRLPAAPPPPPPAAARREPLKAAVREPDPERLIAPVRVPVLPVIAEIANEPAAGASDEVQGGVEGGVPGGVPGGVIGGIPGGVLASVPVAAAPPPPPPVIARSEPAAPKQISVGGNVQAGLILRQVSPPYPSLAKAAHLSGAVEMRAIIGVDGRVKDLTVVSGHPLLVKAAVEAVRQWVYKPTLLNGEPVEVKTVITVTFRLAYA